MHCKELNKANIRVNNCVVREPPQNRVCLISERKCFECVKQEIIDTNIYFYVVLLISKCDSFGFCFTLLLMASFRDFCCSFDSLCVNYSKAFPPRGGC